MDPSRRVQCRMCRGLNDPSNAFCEYCGASLREQGYKTGGGKAVGPLLARTAKRVVFVVVIVAVFGGIYYGVDRLLLPAIRAGANEDIGTATTRVADPTTTTAVALREDRVIIGPDRFATAILVAQAGFPDGAAGLVLAGGEAFAEALCAVPLAAAYRGPLLLVPDEGVTRELAAEIERLAPATVYLVGLERPSRTRSEVLELLPGSTVKSLAGDSVFETAVLIANELKAKTGELTKIVLVPSDNYGAGLSVAYLAAAKGWPILLKPEEDDMPRVTARALDDLEVQSALVVGTSAELELAQVETKTGADAYSISAEVAAYALEQGLSFEHTVFASGEGFPGALVGGAHAAANTGILLLAKPGALPDPIRAVFDEHVADILRLDFIGLRDLAEQVGATGPSSGAPETSGSGGLRER